MGAHLNAYKADFTATNILFNNTVDVRSLAPLICFHSCIETTQRSFNSIIWFDSRD